jgi:hypothetical protein
VALPLPTYLSIAGLALDFLGAMLLAYDVVYGPRARHQASARRDQLALALRKQGRREASANGPVESSNARAIDAILAEIRYWDRHEQRAHAHGVVGLLLLMSGFLSQGLAAVFMAVETGTIRF